MDTRAIGVFDSGLGGLTTVKRLMQIMPNEDIVYLGDTGRVPYGGRSRETIIRYARQDMAFLHSFDIKAVVVACGTVSTNALEEIRKDYDTPTYGVVDAAVNAAVRATKNKKVGLIGTKASVRSGAYMRKLKERLPEAEMFSNPCPLFVPIVEDGRIQVDDPVLNILAEEYLTPLKEVGVDALILGCTHYPLITKTISKIMGPDVALIDPGGETAMELSDYLCKHNMLNMPDHCGTYRYFVSDSTDEFSAIASRFLEDNVGGEVSQISLDDY